MDSDFSLSDSAAKRIAWLLSKEPNPASARLRVAVNGGGCSGFQYHYTFEEEDTARQADDIVIEKDGARVVTDPISLEMMKSSVLDYVEDLSGAMFVIRNPNATAKCGCGNSFSVM